jgi:hypothetical protein
MGRPEIGRKLKAARPREVGGHSPNILWDTILEAVKVPFQDGMIRPHISNDLNIQQQGLQLRRQKAEIFPCAGLTRWSRDNTPSLISKVLQVPKAQAGQRTKHWQFITGDIPVTGNKTRATRQKGNRLRHCLKKCLIMSKPRRIVMAIRLTIHDSPGEPNIINQRGKGNRPG